MMLLDLFSPADLGEVEPISAQESPCGAIATSLRPKSSTSYSPLLEQPRGILFLDIETTGLSRYYDYVTLIGFAIDGEYEVIVAGEDPQPLFDALSRAQSLVTFNGSGFDLPFLEDALAGVRWPRHHVDLRYACKALDLTGGQKEIEQVLGIDCRRGIEGLDGAAAVVLWHRYMRGDHSALRDLIDYNRADVEAMGHILEHVVRHRGATDLFLRPDELRRLCSTPPQCRRFGPRDALLPAPPTHLRRVVHFHDLFRGTLAETATVVGLDLTGSAERPSGFCSMRGPAAETRVLGDDQAILDAVFAARPDLVSIDSPLCLPVGRTRVTDDDPTRDEAGIMRVSERILKRRGINVYPCLLPSMQKLTERGIRLAKEIRDRGIPVIECYPGAAQDIMGIPRKGAGEEWLKLGLSDFGVTGRFKSEKLTHDELDAITCCLVGSFHLAGRTEALGGEGEEPMMVPVL
jgi:predicted nuclease with RNAse H fold